MNFKKFLNKLSNGSKAKSYKNLVVIFLIGIIFVIAASFFKSSNNGNTNKTNSNKSILKNTGDNTEDKSDTESEAKEDYEQQSQSKLKDILSKLDGVGKVEVMVTFESGEENVPAVNSNTDDTKSSTQNTSSGENTTNTQDNTASTVVTTNESNGSTKPLILKTYKPKACSVCVVAEGAEDSLTQARIVKIVTDLFDVSSSKVNVCPMKK